MFIGHYSASFLARSATPSIPLWVFVGATQFLDILWCVFIMLGFERVEADPNVTEGLRFLFYPYTHSLVAAAFWSLAAGLLTKLLLRVNTRSAVLVAGVVLSHWFFDLLVHRADLPFWPGGHLKVGFGLWNAPAIELGLEVALFLLGGLLLVKMALRAGHRLWPSLTFLAFGVLFMAAMRSAEPAPVVDAGVVGAMGLAAYLTFVFLAWMAERLGARSALATDAGAA
jgi:hypothetical protein